jgi:hypothetical protein
VAVAAEAVEQAAMAAAEADLAAQEELLVHQAVAVLEYWAKEQMEQPAQAAHLSAVAVLVELMDKAAAIIIIIPEAVFMGAALEDIYIFPAAVQ